jgi:hypothetical protein
MLKTSLQEAKLEARGNSGKSAEALQVKSENFKEQIAVARC